MSKASKNTKNTNNTNLTLIDPNQTPQWQKAINFCYEEYLLGFAPDQIIKDLSAFLVSTYSIIPEAAALLAPSLYAQFSSPEFLDSINSQSSRRAFLSNIDALYLINHTDFFSLIPSPEGGEGRQQEGEQGQGKQTTPLTSQDIDYIRKIVLSLLFLYHENFHQSGWVKYDRKEVLYLSGASALPVKKQEELTSYIHTHFDFQMRVIGSNTPIPCFCFPWAIPQETPLYMADFGPLTPETLSSLAQIISINKQLLFSSKFSPTSMMNNASIE